MSSCVCTPNTDLYIVKSMNLKWYFLVFEFKSIELVSYFGGEQSSFDDRLNIFNSIQIMTVVRSTVHVL